MSGRRSSRRTTMIAWMGDMARLSLKGQCKCRCFGLKGGIIVSQTG